MYVAGIDIGSTTTEVIVLALNDSVKDNFEITGKSFMPTGFDHQKTAYEAFNEALINARVQKNDVSYVVATGYGRNNVSFANKQVTEIVCHGRGAYFHFPNVHFVIDIGGQDSKVIKLGDKGKVTDFSMNEKCAAGTGRFIEVMANILAVELNQMGDLSFFKTKDIQISSMCTVFAESEIISKISQGHKREDIINGLHNAVVDRVIPMGRRLGFQDDIVMTGGVARNKGVVAAFEQKLKTKIHVPDDPQIMGALGAAIIASSEIIRS